MEPIILASASPRRREILTLLDIPFEAIPARSEESINPALPLSDGVLQVAKAKAVEIAAQYPHRVVLGADTVVAIDGQPLGKPQDEQEAAAMLRQLQGRTHEVYTAVWVCRPGQGGAGFTDRATVTFDAMSEDDIRWYIATGEPMDKAGAYGIQGHALRFIRGMSGDFYTVMGLPSSRLWRFLSGDNLRQR